MPTILTGIFVGVSALFVDIGQAAELTNIGTLAAFIIVCAGGDCASQGGAQSKTGFYLPDGPFDTNSWHHLLRHFNAKPAYRHMAALHSLDGTGMVLYFGYGLSKNKIARLDP